MTPSGRGELSDQTFLTLIIVAAALAVSLGVWIGLGYPGLYDRYEDTGSRAPRVSPFRRLLGGLGISGRRRSRKRSSGTGRWSRH